MGVTGIDQLQFATPGATIDNFSQGIDFNIRGVSEAGHNSQTTVGVVTYRDGITFPGSISRGAAVPGWQPSKYCEDLKVPSGDKMRPAAPVFVNTVDPKIGGGYDGYVQAQAGGYTDFGLQGAVNIPISDTLAARFAFNGESRDGFTICPAAAVRTQR